jgi:ferredoxin-NADP reductase
MATFIRKVIPPKRYLSEVLSTEKLNDRVWEFVFRHINPPLLSFEPGQFIALNVSESAYRTYSIASDYKNQEQLKIIVTAAHDGVGANYLRSLKIGDEVKFIGPSGMLRLKNTSIPQINFFATGTGLAPFIPMLHKLSDIKYGGSINLFFGVRNSGEMFYADNLKFFGSKLKNFICKIYFSQPRENESKSFPFTPGRITQAIQDTADFDPHAHYYLCGHPAMVDECEKTLWANKIPEQNIIFEKFTRSIK